MTKIILLILGIWMMMVAAHNNSLKALEFVVENGKAFVTWIVVIIVISAIYAQQTMKPLATAMLVLMIVAMLVTNSNSASNIMKEMKALQDYASGKGSLCATTNNGTTNSGTTNSGTTNSGTAGISVTVGNTTTTVPYN